MLTEGRCECGCRLFFHKQAIVTTASGSIRDIPSIMILECVSCGTHYSVSTEAGQKTLMPFGRPQAEKILFKAALESWKNTDRPESNDSHIVLEDADKKDFARLGL